MPEQNGKMGARIITRTLKDGETLDENLAKDLHSGEIIVDLNSGKAVIGKEENSSFIRINNDSLSALEQDVDTLDQNLGDVLENNKSAFDEISTNRSRIKELEDSFKAFMEGENTTDAIDTLKEIQGYIDKDEGQIWQTLNNKQDSLVKVAENASPNSYQNGDMVIHVNKGRVEASWAGHSSGLFVTRDPSGRAKIAGANATADGKTDWDYIINQQDLTRAIDTVNTEFENINSKLGSPDDKSNKDTAFGRIKKLEEGDVTALENTVTNVLTPKVTKLEADVSELETTIGESTDTLSETTVFGKIDELNINKADRLTYKKSWYIAHDQDYTIPADSSKYAKTVLTIHGESLMNVFFDKSPTNNSFYILKSGVNIGDITESGIVLGEGTNCKIKFYKTTGNMFCIDVNGKNILDAGFVAFPINAYSITTTRYTKEFTSAEEVKINFSTSQETICGLGANEILNIDIISLISDIYLDSQPAVNYVIEQKRYSNGNYYRKWSDGVLEIWGTYTIPANANGETILYPLWFAQVPNLQVTPHFSDKSITSAYSCFGYTLEKNGFTVTNPLSSALTIHYYACGTWY